VKQKFGGLRFYVDGGNEWSYAAVRVTETLSYYICEESGRPGGLMVGRRRFLRTLAPDVGQTKGYEPYEPRPDDVGVSLPSLTTIDLGAMTLPPGWITLARVLGSVCDASADLVRHISGERTLIPGLDLKSKGAIAAIREMAARTDQLTGLMRAM
jgi:hypothetical protein